MQRTIIILIAALMFLSGCGKSQPRIIGAILPATGKMELTQADWTPSEEQISKAEPDILKYIEQSNPRIFQNLNKYRCQYWGITVEGRKRIYCNFFRLTWDERFSWRTEPVIVFDGGDSYFQLEYDIETEKCLNFMVNGQA